jgi:hypothetical protein
MRNFTSKVITVIEKNFALHPSASAALQETAPTCAFFRLTPP